MVRGKGYVTSTADIERIVVKADRKGTPVLLKDVATVNLGPQIRRGVLDFNGQGDTVGRHCGDAPRRKRAECDRAREGKN